MHGCVSVPLGCLSLGLVPLLVRQGEGHFIQRMDDAGVETRAGKRIAWNEFTRIQRMTTRMGGGTLSDEYQLTSPQGRVSLPLWRAVNARESLEYMLARLPASLQQQQG